MVWGFSKALTDRREALSAVVAPPGCPVLAVGYDRPEGRIANTPRCFQWTGAAWVRVPVPPAASGWSTVIRGPPTRSGRNLVRGRRTQRRLRRRALRRRWRARLAQCRRPLRVPGAHVQRDRDRSRGLSLARRQLRDRRLPSGCAVPPRPPRL